MYHERPDYRVDLLARTNAMTAWLVRPAWRAATPV
jgi:hypothetical protein